MDAVIGYGMLLCPWKNFLAEVLREKFTKKKRDRKKLDAARSLSSSAVF
jgi:hypothetical protein